MTTVDMITEQLLAVDFDNAAQAGKALESPNWQLLAEDATYRLRYVANLLAQANCLQSELNAYKQAEKAINEVYRSNWDAYCDSPDPQIGDDPF